MSATLWRKLRHVLWFCSLGICWNVLKKIGLIVWLRKSKISSLQYTTSGHSHGFSPCPWSISWRRRKINSTHQSLGNDPFVAYCDARSCQDFINISLKWFHVLPEPLIFLSHPPLFGNSLVLWKMLPVNLSSELLPPPPLVRPAPGAPGPSHSMPIYPGCSIWGNQN